MQYNNKLTPLYHCPLSFTSHVKVLPHIVNGQKPTCKQCTTSILWVKQQNNVVHVYFQSNNTVSDNFNFLNFHMTTFNNTKNEVCGKTDCCSLCILYINSCNMPSLTGREADNFPYSCTVHTVCPVLLHR